MYTSPKQIKYIPDNNAISHFNASPYYDPDRICLIDPLTNQKLTYRQVREATLRFATVLHHRFSIRRNDVVLLSTVNSIYLQIIHHAILTLGAIVSPANVQYTTKELGYQIESVRPKLLIASDINSVKGALGVASHKAQTISLREVTGLISQVAKHSGVAMAAIEPVDGRTQPAYYVLSSGTSGLPKTVVLTHTNIAVNMLQWVQQGSAIDIPYATCCCALPMSHALALTVYIWVSPFVGSTMVVFPKFDLEPLLKAICDYKIQTMAVVPPVVLAFSKSPLVDKYPVMDSLRYLASAAAPLPESLISATEARLRGLKIEQLYGQSETSPISIGCMDTATGGPLGSVYKSAGIGWAVASTQVRLVDPTTEKDSTTNRGEVWIKGPQVMLGYLNNPEANASTFCDGWLRTGDIAVVDETGQFTIVDRIKELIKSKGHQVAPAELEGMLLDHPDILDCAVIGVPDDDGVTEQPRAYCVLKEGVDPLRVIQEFNSKVAVHKQLWGGLVVVKTVPKSPSGKILRRLLRDTAKLHDAIGRHLAGKSAIVREAAKL